ncbi:uncharacterized protein NPIL_626641 [Nephila pilipes]|uniref:Uncharacterized protein n=1 Tax=Nephila pilipes TaxID=299642 RepID=A0A8X6MS19_NEPPI|nr:uncharacterized protein NPIL_626641 [Nephila pilipes]
MLTEVSGLEPADSGKGKIQLLLGMDFLCEVIRGAPELLYSTYWFCGPPFLSLPEEKWPISKLPPSKTIEGQSERRSKIEISLHCATEKNENGREPVLKFGNYSSWERLRRLSAWIQRFCRNARKVKDHDSGELSAEELEGAEIYWMKYIQEENYPEDIKALKTNKSIPKDSKIFKLSPFLSETGKG